MPDNSKLLYRLYIDESGDHRYGKKSIANTVPTDSPKTIRVSYEEYPELEDTRNRYLSLTGCIIESVFYSTTFCSEMEQLKKKYFAYDPDDPLIFHREDMINCRHSFYRLRNSEVRKAFNDDLLLFFSRMPYTVITVVIDKKAHIQKYGDVAFHPYHYCLTAMLERYCGFLSFYGAKGDVLAESRGGREDEKLKKAYQSLYFGGSGYWHKSHFQTTLTTKEIKLQKKTQNIAGLQLSDLIAHPAKCHILSERGCMPKQQDFGTEVIKTVETKFNRHHFSGKTEGYGRVFL